MSMTNSCDMVLGDRRMYSTCLLKFTVVANDWCYELNCNRRNVPIIVFLYIFEFFYHIMVSSAFLVNT